MSERSPGDIARGLAAESVAANDPTGWFERLYSAAGRGDMVVPWHQDGPDPLLVRWASAIGLAGRGRSAAVVGCGLGDDAEYIAGLGFTTVAFDVSPSAVEQASGRFPGSDVRYEAADLLALPAAWNRRYDLVVENFTVQSLPVPVRETAIANVAALVAPGGTLIVHATYRRGAERPGPPWPLDRADVESFRADGLVAQRIDDIPEPRYPGLGTWQAEFRRAG
jgi:SAM-dependent methyltransferase